MYYNFTSNIMGKGSFSIEMEMGQLKNKIENKKKELIQLVARHGLIMIKFCYLVVI